MSEPLETVSTSTGTLVTLAGRWLDASQGLSIGAQKAPLRTAETSGLPWVFSETCQGHWQAVT